MMEIYFAGSIRGGRDDQDTYHKIISYLKKYGKVLTPHVGDPSLSAFGDKGIDDSDIFKRDMKWMKQADVLIAEVTSPSHGVGYEIAQAEAQGKRILCLYKIVPGKRVSALLLGNRNLFVIKYHDLKDAFKIIDNFLKSGINV